MDAHEQPVEIIANGPEWLVVAMEVPGISPADLLAWFVDARLINTWWGTEAIVEPRSGGRYLVQWSGPNWTMRGSVATLTSDTLVYSWTWDHERDQVPRTVVVHVDDVPAGARVILSHGPYRDGSAGDPEAATDRLGHLDGWSYFLPQLRAKIREVLSVEFMGDTDAG